MIDRHSLSKNPFVSSGEIVERSKHDGSQFLFVSAQQPGIIESDPWPEDAQDRGRIACEPDVSIRARPIGRAMRYSRNFALRKKILAFSREPFPDDK
jgi:hypothetical protein